MDTGIIFILSMLAGSLCVAIGFIAPSIARRIDRK